MGLGDCCSLTGAGGEVWGWGTTAAQLVSQGRIAVVAGMDGDVRGAGAALG